MVDKKDYKLTLKALDATATVAVVMNRLGEISIETEDDNLKRIIIEITARLRAEHAKPTEKIRLLSLPQFRPSIKALHELVTHCAGYCNQCIASGQKQWEILATRAGWTPPQQG